MELNHDLSHAQPNMKQMKIQFYEHKLHTLHLHAKKFSLNIISLGESPNLVSENVLNIINSNKRIIMSKKKFPNH